MNQLKPLYLSTQNSPFENFVLFAEKNITSTEPLAKAYEEYMQQEFNAKGGALLVTGVALVAIAAFAVVAVGIVPAGGVASMAGLSFIGLKYLQDRESTLRGRLKEKAQDDEFIFNQITKLFYDHVEIKENVLIKSLNWQERSKPDAEKSLEKLVKNYDSGVHTDLLLSDDAQTKMKEYVQLRDLALTILGRIDRPYIITPKRWTDLQKACAHLVYGRNGVQYGNQKGYLPHVLGDFHGYSESALLIHKDESYVELYETDKKATYHGSKRSFKCWEARKHA